MLSTLRLLLFIFESKVLSSSNLESLIIFPCFFKISFAWLCLQQCTQHKRLPRRISFLLQFIRLNCRFDSLLFPQLGLFSLPLLLAFRFLIHFYAKGSIVCRGLSYQHQDLKNRLSLHISHTVLLFLFRYLSLLRQNNKVSYCI